MDIPQLRNYIPIAGPARREPVDGSETDMRVHIPDDSGRRFRAKPATDSD
jgi:hypothetical protein